MCPRFCRCASSWISVCSPVNIEHGMDAANVVEFPRVCLSLLIFVPSQTRITSIAKRSQSSLGPYCTTFLQRIRCLYPSTVKKNLKQYQNSGPPSFAQDISLLLNRLRISKPKTASVDKICRASRFLQELANCRQLQTAYNSGSFIQTVLTLAFHRSQLRLILSNFGMPRLSALQAKLAMLPSVTATFAVACRLINATSNCSSCSLLQISSSKGMSHLVTSPSNLGPHQE